jgi:hypothetical protein
MVDRKIGAAQEMSEQNALEARRKFLKKAGKTALTVPAVALLLSAESKLAQAQQAPSGTVIR